MLLSKSSKLFTKIQVFIKKSKKKSFFFGIIPVNKKTRPCCEACSILIEVFRHQFVDSFEFYVEVSKFEFVVNTFPHPVLRVEVFTHNKALG